MSLYLYNTEKRIKEKISPLKGDTVLMYTCGPTVYDFAHIGNFRTFVFEDLLRRSLKFFGLHVKQAMNLTDIDDKTLKGAIERKITLKEFTEPYIDAFFEDLRTLHIEPVEFYPKATDYIPEMIALIQKLIDKKIAYFGADGSVYFSIHKFPSYGRLSHLHLHELKAGASERVASDEYDKETAADFVLWKRYDPERDGEIYWESPFGQGRPGWHIECSAMAMKLLGESIDIHVGGVDNIFPHHENEIAQVEACTCKQFVAHWVHAEHLLVNHKKMSKSLGNFYTLRDLLQKGYKGTTVRYLLLQGHYRMQLNFTFEGLDAADAALERFKDFIFRLRGIKDEKSYGLVQPLLKSALAQFTEAIAEDLNLSPAFGALFDLVREINALCDAETVGKAEAKEVLKFLERCDLVLGVLPLEEKEEPVPKELQEALAEREKARKDKNWAAADVARAFISSKGYMIEDTPQGARLKRIK